MLNLSKWLLTHLMFGTVHCFAAGAVAELGMGGGDGGVVTESTADTGGETLDGATDNGTESSGESEAATTEDGTNNNTEQPDVPGDGRTLPADLKALVAELKTKNPQLATKIKDLEFGRQAFKREFPGGLKEVREFKTFLGEIGGKEGIGQLQAEVNEWRAVDKDYTEANPAFIDKISSNEPESFAKLMPHAINKYADSDPDGYQRVMSGVFHSTLQNSGVLNTLYLAKQNLSLGKTDEAVKLLDSIDQWANGIGELAKSQPKAKEVDTAAQQRDSELKDRELKLFNKELSSDFVPFRASAIQKELGNQKLVAANAKVDPEKMEIFEERVIRKIAQINDADPKFKETFNKYYNAGDKDGLLKFIKERFNKHVPEAVKSVSRILPLGAVAAKRPAQANTVKPAVAVEAGFKQVAGPPRTDQVDHSKTSMEMKWKSQAILKDGSKVTWATA